MDDEEFLRRFEDCSFPGEQFHHREHVKVAYLYLHLRRHPPEKAMEHVRAGIKKYNAAHGTPEALDRGYHETITQAWLRLVHFTLCEYGPADTADQFFDQHPQLWHAKVLRLFYSHDRIMSLEAKAWFVEPDITPLPSPLRA